MLKMSYLAAAITAFLLMVAGAIGGDAIMDSQTKQLRKQVTQLESSLETERALLEIKRAYHAVLKPTADTFLAAYISQVTRDMKGAEQPMEALDTYFALVGKFDHIAKQLQADERWAAGGSEARLASFEACRLEFIMELFKANVDELFERLKKARRQAVRLGQSEEFDRKYESLREQVISTDLMRSAVLEWSAVEKGFEGASR